MDLHLTPPATEASTRPAVVDYTPPQTAFTEADKIRLANIGLPEDSQAQLQLMTQGAHLLNIRIQEALKALENQVRDPENNFALAELKQGTEKIIHGLLEARVHAHGDEIVRDLLARHQVQPMTGLYGPATDKLNIALTQAETDLPKALVEARVQYALTRTD